MPSPWIHCQPSSDQNCRREYPPSFTNRVYWEFVTGYFDSQNDLAITIVSSSLGRAHSGYFDLSLSPILYLPFGIFT